MPFSLNVCAGAIATLGALIAVSAGADAAADSCKPQYVVPYAEQCDFNYHQIRKDPSVGAVATAYDSCARAQAVAIVCVKSPDKQVHAVAASALYRDVGEQAEIALFSQHFPLAEALLREKRDVLRMLQADRPAQNDADFSRERASIATDLQDAKAGECTTKALGEARDQGDLGRQHKYADLAELLAKKAHAYDRCAALTTTPQKHAYVLYESLVALEESGRAAQGAGNDATAHDRFTKCLAQANGTLPKASPIVRNYLVIVHDLCKGRMQGKIAFDQPTPLDQDAGKSFVPLGLPN